MRMLFVCFVLFSLTANAWMDAWAPTLKSTPAKFQKLSEKSVKAFFSASDSEYVDIQIGYAEGGMLDLNGDGIKDFVFIIPCMGNGLNASLNTAHFVVSDGTGGRMETMIDGYGAGLDDLVQINGKVYFRFSDCFNPSNWGPEYEFEKSKHNHWVYQMFSFDTNGVMKCANADFGGKFPAVTIFYDKPKFKQIELTAADLKLISKCTEFKSKKYNR